MLVKLFKVLTSLVVVAVLVTVVYKRDITALISQHEPKLLTQKIAELPQVTLNQTTRNEDRPVSGEKPPESPHINQNVVAVEKNNTDTPQVKQPNTITEVSTPYIKMEEGHSDNDESYKPSVSPCSVVTGYKLGTFDTRFGISKETFLQEIKKSASIWNDAADKQLFTYDMSGTLTINLIYDERQARTVDVNYLILDIENAKLSAEALKKEYEVEKNTYKQEGDSFTSDSAAFQMRYDIYTKKVEDYNARGGASRTEYDEMMNTLTTLKGEAAALETRRLSLITMMDSINKKVARYNEFVVYINSLIVKSNALGAKKFTEGRFVPSTNSIDIYQYSDIAKLQRVITHELGHALGINHNTNVRSIMYAVNSATTTMLSNEDLRDLRKVCAQ